MICSANVLTISAPREDAQLLLGHRKLENTVRHLGVELQDAQAISEDTEI
jgi:hypothetical protein